MSSDNNNETMDLGRPCGCLTKLEEAIRTQHGETAYVETRTYMIWMQKEGADYKEPVHFREFPPIFSRYEGRKGKRKASIQAHIAFRFCPLCGAKYTNRRDL